MKLRYYNILIIGLLFLSFFSTQPRPVSAWGLPTHQFIAEKAVENLDGEWKVVFQSLIAKYKAGAIYPDSLHPQDTPNHLYYPDNPSGTTAPQAIERWYNSFTGNLSKGDYGDAIFAAGVFTHYISDLNIPVHTDSYWDGHPAYESDINANLENFVLGTITIDTISDIKQYAIEKATYSHQFYQDIRNAYPDGTTTDVISNNATIKTITQDQLTRAISSTVSLLLKGIGQTLAPTINFVSTQKALIDNGHGNDYAAGDLDVITSYLTGLGFSVAKNNGSMTSTILNDVDFLIITALSTNYTSDELTAISTWLDGGHRSLFVTGRGDFENIAISGINELLSNIGTVIRINDDNVYTIASDPNYYKDWYIYSTVTNPPPGKSFNDQAILYHSFSPNSLYFTGSSSGLTLLVNGSEYNYQTDQQAPAPAKIWDNTNDGVGGDKIPLVACESLSNNDDRIVVFGASDFSDFSFVPSGFQDDEYFLPTFIEWVLFDSSSEGIQYQPNLKIITTQTTFPTGSITINYSVSSNAKEVQLLIDSEIKETDSASPFNYFTFDLTEGTYNLTLLVTGSTGLTTSKSMTIIVEPGSQTTAAPWETFSVVLAIFGMILIRMRKKS
ncbi:MAG: zinc dependent phospholipase C family protein [Candidatus Thorarchaeota archaeon]